MFFDTEKNGTIAARDSSQLIRYGAECHVKKALRGTKLDSLVPFYGASADANTKKRMQT